MSLLSYNPYDRYRQRSINRLGRIFAVLVTLGVIFAIGFWLGRQSSLQDTAFLQRQIRDAHLQRDKLQDMVTELGAKAQTAMTRMEEIQEQYQRAAPEAPVEGIMELVQRQISQGMDPERLAFVIRSARPPQNCSEPETRRFVISTPTYSGPESQVKIGDITLEGSGVSARNENGNPEAWYDPSKKILVEFTAPDGRMEKKEDVMPLHHSMVSGAREYRFTIEEGARSFAKVTFDSCDYP